jgi:hypothetical protein
MADLRKTFSAEGDFDANTEAEDFLRTAGFSVGSMQRGAPRGIMFGECDISKWRNLRETEIQTLHGEMRAHRSFREGPITVIIFESAPQEAKRAFHQTALTLSE